MPLPPFSRLPTVLAALAVLTAWATSIRAGDLPCPGARKSCVAAARWSDRVCARDCTRRPELSDIVACRSQCRTVRNQASAACDDGPVPCHAICPNGDAGCAAELRACRLAARAAQGGCRMRCGGRSAMRCLMACDRLRAGAEASCSFTPTPVIAGLPELPSLPMGRPANLSVLLDDAEMAVVTAADARATALRSRPLRLATGVPGADVNVTQIRHAFQFGFPVDFRKLTNPDNLAFYTGITREHTSLAVMEASLKWRQFEPSPGVYNTDLPDSELAWAQANGFAVKGHTLLWGNAPPFSTGTGIPDWLRTQFPNETLTADERTTLHALLQHRVEVTVSRYRGRLSIWDVTNETLNIFTPWFMARLGPGIVNEMFHWVRRLDPGAQLVFNEWITEVFTGLPGPSAADVRNRVRALLAAGVPIDAIGQQAHFVPGIVYAGGTADLSQRTRIDDYAVALDTLAEVGLPLHMTETNFVTPNEPEARAAQAEALMRLWWGHPAVEQIVFWGLWGKVAGRSFLQNGLWDDAGVLSRHGEAVIALLNDRWRTRAVVTADSDGTVALTATLGDYVASWMQNGAPVHVRFRVERGVGTAVIAAVGTQHGDAERR